jgi:hypothetical protein
MPLNFLKLLAKERITIYDFVVHPAQIGSRIVPSLVSHAEAHLSSHSSDFSLARWAYPRNQIQYLGELHIPSRVFTEEAMAKGKSACLPRLYPFSAPLNLDA